MGNDKTKKVKNLTEVKLSEAVESFTFYHYICQYSSLTHFII